MGFFCFNQNNTGGSWQFEEGQISHFVLIEADSATQANAKAEDIGIYFDGCESGRDCSCCGNRWYKVHKNEGTNKPMIYDQDVSGGVYTSDYLWMGKNPEGYIHYANGETVAVVGRSEKKEEEELDTEAKIEKLEATIKQMKNPNSKIAQLVRLIVED